MPTGVQSGVGPDAARHVNETTQWAFTIGNWSLAIVALIIAVALSRRRHNWTSLVIVGAGGVFGTFVEPLFDSYFHLWFYEPGQWTFIETHGISQPVWVLPTYLWFYGGQALFVYTMLVNGAGRAQVTRCAGAIFVIATTFELIGINLGVYEYWGPQALTVMDFPVWISLENAAIPTITALLVFRLEPYAQGPRKLLLAFVTPAVLVAFWYGTSFLAIDLMNTPDPSQTLLTLAALFSVAAGTGVLNLAIRALTDGLGGESPHAPDHALAGTADTPAARPAQSVVGASKR